jgi:hypothetical protein
VTPSPEARGDQAPRAGRNPCRDRAQLQRQRGDDFEAMMMNRPDYLFTQFEARSVQGDQKERMQSEIAAYDGSRLLNTNVDDLVSYFRKKYEGEIPVLLEDQKSVDYHEAQRDVSGDPRRMAFHLNRGPVHVTGTEIIVEVPFTGDANMFHVQPTSLSG